MNFYSTPFLIFFPLALLLYLLIFRKKYGNLFLLTISILFYAWGEKANTIVIIASIICNYIFALLIDNYRVSHETRKKPASTLIMVIAICFNLGLLFFYKYIHFFVTTLTFGSVQLSPWHLPIGLSFFTFKALSYIIDVSRGTIRAEKSIIYVGLYISIFPQVIAGPISRFPDMQSQIKERQIGFGKVINGINRFVIGMGKKLIIADTIGTVVNQIFALDAGELSAHLSWLGAFLYTIQIYFDFSGYTDMALGLGTIFGFDFMENFNYPYISRSIREFWKRWHISLSTWFRDYLYIPLGGNRVSNPRMYVNLLIVFLLCGLWHGASWCFIVWGLWHGFFLVIERRKFGRIIDSLYWPVRNAYAFIVVMVGWVIFRSPTIEYAWGFIKSMLGFQTNSAVYYPATFIDGNLIFALCLGMLFSFPIAPGIKKILDSFTGGNKETFAKYLFSKMNMVLYELTIVFIIIICTLQMGDNKDSTFIYSLF